MNCKLVGRKSTALMANWRDTLKHDYGTVADFLQNHPDAALDMMTPSGFVHLTPELSAGLLVGRTVPAHPGCPGSELERTVEANEILRQTFLEFTQDKKDPTIFYALTDWSVESLKD